MKKLYATDLLFTSTPEQVSRLLKLDQTNSESWHAEDLRSMVRHQMAAPLSFDLGSIPLSPAEQKTAAETLAQATRSDIPTFGDLFQTEHPPIELLKLCQKFFKQNAMSHPKGSPEQQVGYLFYLLSIVTARVRTGINPSKLSDADQLHGIQSILDRAWIDEPIRQLLVQGQRRIAAG